MRAPKTKAMPATKAVKTKPTPSNMEAQTKAPAALEQKTSEPNPQEWANPRFAPSAPQTQPAATGSVKPAPLGISGTKEAQLQALLAAYKADKITPAQYHTERARILAEP
jgi:hypothetical protein